MNDNSNTEAIMFEAMFSMQASLARCAKESIETFLKYETVSFFTRSAAIERLQEDYQESKDLKTALDNERAISDFKNAAVKLLKI